MATLKDKKDEESEFKIDGELLMQGAEARIYKSKYEKKMTIVKHRFIKKYRHKQLDLRLRKNRSKNETKSMTKAKEFGIRTPQLYYYDKAHCAIHMEFIDLPMVKTVLKSDTYFNAKMNNYNETKCELVLKEIGKCIALFHKNNYIHGDLTTSNMLIDEENGNEIVLIDFGLAKGTAREEDKAVDLYVLERALVSTHPFSEFMVEIILKYYQITYSKGVEKVMKRLETVRKRGRKRCMLG